MIVNLIGPPGVGKSTYASRFVLEHPYYRYCSIDACRIDTWKEELSSTENNKEAWRSLYNSIRDSKDCVVETIGLDWRLDRIFSKLASRPRLNIAITGDPKDIVERLKDRQHKRPLPYQYRFQDEVDTVYYALEELEKDSSRFDYLIDTTGKTPEDIYRVVTVQITNFRINHTG